jgi:hypothetical protein
MVFYLVYRTKNLLTGEYYIGAHKTTNIEDGYFGSGLLVNRAINKHGIEKFEREILYFADSIDEMYSIEKNLVVTRDKDCMSYNLVPGGNKPPVAKKGRKCRRPKFENGYDYKHTEETKDKIRKWTVENQPMNNLESRKKLSESRMGIVFSDKHKQNLSIAHKGKPSNRKGKTMSEEQKRESLIRRKKKNEPTV